VSANVQANLNRDLQRTLYGTPKHPVAQIDLEAGGPASIELQLVHILSEKFQSVGDEVVYDH